jgi:putative two-component system response regulator
MRQGEVAMDDLVLFVDDEPNILNALSRQFSDESFSIFMAPDCHTALAMLEAEPVSVIVTDNIMPGMTGIELLSRAREISPKTIRILLTGHADMNAAIRAINAGEVYKFITKPWDQEELRRIIYDGLQKHRVTESMQRADEAMLRSLAQTIELKDMYTRGHCDRVADYAERLSQTAGLSSDMQRCIRYGSWLHDCGKIGVPEAILNFRGPLAADSMLIVKNHCQWGAEVARLANLAEAVVNVIRYHHERFDGKGYPSGLKGETIPVEARIVAIADTFDALISDRPYRKAMSIDQGYELLERLCDGQLDPILTELFLKLMKRRTSKRTLK